jgi:uncharacterized protein with von Willebrand factor type A (vWA) domain
VFTADDFSKHLPSLLSEVHSHMQAQSFSLKEQTEHTDTLLCDMKSLEAKLEDCQSTELHARTLCADLQSQCQSHLLEAAQLKQQLQSSYEREDKVQRINHKLRDDLLQSKKQVCSLEQMVKQSLAKSEQQSLQE